MSNKYAILLDIDGVIIKDSKLLNKVSQSAVRYVGYHTKSRTPVHENRRLYMKYGHTLIGLKAEYEIQDNLLDYNRFIYNKDTLIDLYVHINSEEFEDEILSDYKKFKETCDKNNMPIYIFSNAPLNWTIPIAKKLKLKPSNIIYNSRNNIIKPQSRSYSVAETYINILEKGHHKCIFIDDSPINLNASMRHPNWIPIQYGNEYTKLEKLNDIINAYNKTI